MPISYVSKLLKHLHTFYPCIALTPQTLKKSSYNATFSDMFTGTYGHFEDWRECIQNYLTCIGFNESELHLSINIDGILLFNDGRKHRAHPILIKILHSSKIFCAGI